MTADPSASKDARRDDRWECVRAGSAHIWYLPGSRSAQYASTIESATRKALRAFKKLVPRPEHPKITILLLDAPARSDPTNGQPSPGTYSDPSQSTIDVVVGDSEPEPIARALIKIIAPQPQAPNSLTRLLDGYALHVAGLGDDDLLLRERHLPLFEDADEPLRSAMTVSFVRSLIRLANQEQFLSILRTRDPAKVDEAVRQTYGRGLPSLENQWRLQLASPASKVGTGGFLRLAFRYVRPYAWREAESFIYMVLGLGFTTLFPFALKRLVDTELPSGQYSDVAVILAVLGAAMAVSLLAGWRRAYLGAYVSSSVIRKLRLEFFDHLQRLHLGWFVSRQQGDVLSRLFSDVAAFEGGLSSVLREGLFQLLSLTVSGVALYILSPGLSLVILIGAPLIALVYKVMGKGALKRSRSVQDETGILLTVAAENLSAQPVVKAFGLELAETEKFSHASSRLFRKQMSLQLYGGIFSTSVNTIATALRIAVLALGAWLVLRHELTVGGLVGFMSLTGEFLGPVAILTGMGQQIQASAGALARINETLNSRPDIIDVADAPSAPRMSREIRFDRVDFSYDEGTLVLADLNLTIPAGQRVAIVGSSGAGKSSILNLVLRLYDPQTGTVTFDGHDLRDVSTASVRDQIGVVLQDTFLFEGTLRDNVRLGNPAAADAEVDAALSAAELDAFIASLPKGANTLVGERGTRLSGGQRQRVAIARALLRDPQVLIFDEATSALDPSTEASLTRTLDHVSDGRTTIAVTHRLTSIANYDRIVVLANGAIREQGNHDELIRLGGEYAHLWSEQQRATSSLYAIEPADALARFDMFVDSPPDLIRDGIEASSTIELT